MNTENIFQGVNSFLFPRVVDIKDKVRNDSDENIYQMSPQLSRLSFFRLREYTRAIEDANQVKFLREAISIFQMMNNIFICSNKSQNP